MLAREAGAHPTSVMCACTAFRVGVFYMFLFGSLTLVCVQLNGQATKAARQLQGLGSDEEVEESMGVQSLPDEIEALVDPAEEIFAEMLGSGELTDRQYDMAEAIVRAAFCVGENGLPVSHSDSICIVARDTKSEQMLADGYWQHEKKTASCLK